MPKSQDTSGNPTRRGLLRAFGLGVVTTGLTRTPTLAETSDVAEGAAVLGAGVSATSGAVVAAPH